DDHSVSIVNDTYQERTALKVRARVYSLDAKLLWDKEVSADVPADSAKKIIDIDNVENLTPTYFLRLNLRDARGRAISDNFYWLSTKADTLDWAKKQDTVYTPQGEFGDLTGLSTLRQVYLESSVVMVESMGAASAAHIRLKNSSNSVAFQIRLRLANRKADTDVVPVFWDDNYFSLLPGEERIVAVSSPQLPGAPPVIQLSGFNIVPADIAAH